jgi:protein-arginine kinase activator protein McsA
MAQRRIAPAVLENVETRASTDRKSLIDSTDDVHNEERSAADFSEGIRTSGISKGEIEDVTKARTRGNSLRVGIRSLLETLSNEIVTAEAELQTAIGNRDFQLCATIDNKINALKTRRDKVENDAKASAEADAEAAAEAAARAAAEERERDIAIAKNEISMLQAKVAEAITQRDFLVCAKLDDQIKELRAFCEAQEQEREEKPVTLNGKRKCASGEAKHERSSKRMKSPGSGDTSFSKGDKPSDNYCCSNDDNSGSESSSTASSSASSASDTDSDSDAGLESFHVSNRKLNPPRATSNRREVEEPPERKLLSRPVDGYIGVAWSSTRGKWNARVSWHGKFWNGGRYETEKEAALAHDALARRLCLDVPMNSE